MKLYRLINIEKLKKYFRQITWQDAVVAFGFSLIIPVSGWILDFIVSGLPLSIKGFVRLHNENPLHYYLDIFPFVVLIVFIGYKNWYQDEKHEYEDLLKEKDYKINKHAVFAQRIGEGDYSTDIELFGDDDVLGKALILMRDNLRANHQKESEQSWIAEGKEIISNILRMYNKIDELSYEVLVNLIKHIKLIQGALYFYDEDSQVLKNVATYAYNRRKYINQEFAIGKGLIGQCAYEMDYIYRVEIPDDYITITSGILGDRKPRSILIVPLVTDDKLQGVLEFASLDVEIPELTKKYLLELGEIIARTIFNLRVNQRTEKLLTESQEMTRVLQENEEELRQNAEEMRATQEELEHSNEQLESQIKAVENAQKRLHSLLENASEIITIYDKDLRMTYVSPSVSKILGFTPDEMMRGKDLERLTRKGEMEFKKMLETLVEDPETPITIQYTYIKNDGKKIFLETTGRNLLHDQALKGVILNSQDITARKKAEKEERMRSRMQSLSENSLDMIIRINTIGQFFYANPVVEDYLGLKPIEIMNKRNRELEIPEVFQNYFDEIIDKIKATPGKMNSQLSIPIKMGEKVIERIMSVDAIPEFNENELETILIVGHDITEAKRIEIEIQEKNRKIEDSINYAQRIQSAILPNSAMLKEVLPKSFIFYKPRDVVSGDFPWFFKKEHSIYVAVVDCTGHGVPGALLSFVGYFTLSNVVDHDEELTAGKIMDKVHYNVRNTLNQDRPDATARDGMDIAFCKIDLKKKELQYAGAHRPLMFVRDGELQEYKGNRKAIGGIPHPKKPEQPFVNHVISLKEGDKFFFYSDGLSDQVGGNEGKKYSSARVKDIILSHKDFSMSQFNNFFVKDFKEWVGNDVKQVDDVLLIGIEI